MDLLSRLDKVVFLQEAVKEYTNAFEFITALKKKLRTITSGNFLKVTFDSGYAGMGMVFVKFANTQWKKATETDLRNSKINFIIAIEGFDDAGDIDGQIVVEMFKFFDDNGTLTKIRKKKTNSLGDAYRHVVRYFQDNEDELVTSINEEGLGGTTASGGEVSTDVSGGTTTNNIAVYKKKLGEPCEKCGKCPCKCMNESDEDPFTSINKRPVKEEEGIVGGKADDMTIEDVFKKQKNNGWEGSLEDMKKEYEMGVKVEMEHTKDKELAKEISRDHLEEIPDYYSRLAKMEKGAGIEEH